MVFVCTDRFKYLWKVFPRYYFQSRVKLSLILGTALRYSESEGLLLCASPLWWCSCHDLGPSIHPIASQNLWSRVLRLWTARSVRKIAFSHSIGVLTAFPAASLYRESRSDFHALPADKCYFASVYSGLFMIQNLPSDKTFLSLCIIQPFLYKAAETQAFPPHLQATARLTLLITSNASFPGSH